MISVLLKRIDSIPGVFFVISVMLIGLAPFHPEPYLVTFGRALLHGEPVSVWAMLRAVGHALPWLGLATKLARDTWRTYASDRSDDS